MLEGSSEGWEGCWAWAKEEAERRQVRRSGTLRVIRSSTSAVLDLSEARVAS